MKTLWEQGSGYNDFVTTRCPHKWGYGTRAPVGCVATAVGQIMAFHKSPAIFKGRKMDWDKMVERKKVRNKKNMFSTYYDLPDNYTDARGDISHLLFRLGDSDLLDMEYGCDGSGALMDDALKTFKKLGYRNARKVGYNSATAVSEIKNNRPVYIRGSATYTDTERRRCFLWWCWTTTNRTYNAGHAWVLDGYVKRTQLVTATLHFCQGTSNYYTYSYNYNNYLELVHNNFGWGGSVKGNYSKSGWYHKGLFNSNIGPDKTSNTYKGGVPYDFKYNNNILINIEP